MKAELKIGDKIFSVESDSDVEYIKEILKSRLIRNVMQHFDNKIVYTIK